MFLCLIKHNFLMIEVKRDCSDHHDHRAFYLSPHDIYIYGSTARMRKYLLLYLTSIEIQISLTLVLPFGMHGLKKPIAIYW